MCSLENRASETKVECKQCRPNPRVSCFSVHQKEALIFWNSALRPVDDRALRNLHRTDNMKFSDQSAIRLSVPAAFTEGVFEDKESRQSMAASQEERSYCKVELSSRKIEDSATFSGQSAVRLAERSTLTEGSSEDEGSRQNSSALQAESSSVEVAGNRQSQSKSTSRHKAALIVTGNELSGPKEKEMGNSVPDVDQADSRNESVVTSAADGIIHVFNKKKCVDKNEIEAGSKYFEPETLRLAQENDLDIAPVLLWKKMLTKRPSWNETAKYSETAKNYCAQWKSLEVVDGILYRNWSPANGRVNVRQLVVPYSLRHEFVARVHGVIATGHFGIRKTQEQFQRRGYFMHWRQYVENFCKRCSVCAKFHRGRPPKQSLLKSIDCGAVNERWQCDLSGPYPSSDGYRYICICVDAFSRYLVASPIRDKSALSVAKVLVRDVITKFGCFQSLQTDNGKEFQNEIIHHICQLLNIDQLKITSYRPSGNGRCEIINKTLHSLMGRVVADSQKDWSQWLSMCVLAYNTSRHESTGQMPYYLMYSREAIIPLDLLLENFQHDEDIDYNAYAEETEDRMRRAFDLVQKHQDVQIERMKRYYNVGVKPKTFKVNDLVYYYYPRKYAGRTPKWSRVYSGVYRIEKVVNDTVYVIRKTPQCRPIVANVDKLKFYYGEVPICWRKVIKDIEGRSANDCGQNTDGSAPLIGEIAAPVADKAAGIFRPSCCKSAARNCCGRH